MAKSHTQALELIKNEVDNLTKQIMRKEQLIATTVSEAEELQSIQNELIETIKHLGASNVEQNIPSPIGNSDPIPSGQS